MVEMSEDQISELIINQLFSNFGGDYVDKRLDPSIPGKAPMKRLKEAEKLPVIWMPDHGIGKRYFRTRLSGLIGPFGPLYLAIHDGMNLFIAPTSDIGQALGSTFKWLSPDDPVSIIELNIKKILNANGYEYEGLNNRYRETIKDRQKEIRTARRRIRWQKLLGPGYVLGKIRKAGGRGGGHLTYNPMEEGQYKIAYKAERTYVVTSLQGRAYEAPISAVSSELGVPEYLVPFALSATGLKWSK